MAPCAALLMFATKSLVMKQKFWIAVALITLCICTLILTISSGLAQLKQTTEFESPGQTTPAMVAPPTGPEQVLSTACALQPERQPKKLSARDRLARARSFRIAASSITLDRFRQSQPSTAEPLPLGSSYTPREEIAIIDPTNFGDRFVRDLNGKPALLDPIVVLHETVGSASSAINFFRHPHANDADQASYHTLVKLDGTITYLVPPDKRAFGAGNSAFRGLNGLESVRTNPQFPGSVNNFAYHVSLETPSDGQNNAYRHRGYTEAQYQSLAWLVARTGIPDSRITTHKAVDRSRSRMDPRSFNTAKFMALLNTHPRTTEISIQCVDPTQNPSF